MAGVGGRFLGLKVNGAFVSCETSCNISFGRELTPASAVDSGGWKEFIAGIREWGISVDGNLLLEAVGSDVKSLLTAGFFNDNPIYIQFSTSPTSDIELVFSGLVKFNNADITAAATGVANWRCVLKGTGKLEFTYQDYSLLIDAMPAQANYPIVVDQDVV